MILTAILVGLALLALSAHLLLRALDRAEQEKLDRSYMRAVREGQERGQ